MRNDESRPAKFRHSDFFSYYFCLAAGHDGDKSEPVPFVKRDGEIPDQDGVPGDPKILIRLCLETVLLPHPDQEFLQCGTGKSKLGGARGKKCLEPPDRCQLNIHFYQFIANLAFVKVDRNPGGKTEMPGRGLLNIQSDPLKDYSISPDGREEPGPAREPAAFDYNSGRGWPHFR